MEVLTNKYYILGDYRMEPDARVLYRGDQRIRLANRPFSVLQYLIEQRERLVSREELLDRFWDGRDVYDDALRKSVGAIRKALDDSVSEPRFVETRWAGGYRYIGPVEERIGRADSGTVEIERTRGFRIVVEEEIQDAPPLYPEAEAVQARDAIASVKPSAWYTRKATAGLALTILAVTLMTAFVEHRARLHSAVAAENPSGPTRIDSIAVMPLRNLSGDPAQEYFSDGLTETFITELSRIKNLKVIARGSSFTFKDKDTDSSEVGRRLGVAAVLEGSVLKSGDRVRVDVRLVSTEDGRVLWVGDTYNRTLKDIFATQDEIACSVATELRIKVCGEGAPPKRYTNNTDAYQAYLKGRYFINNQYSLGAADAEKNLNRAAEYFTQAVQMDPKYAQAYDGLADAYTQVVWFTSEDPRRAIARAKAAAEKAIELDNSMAETHTALASAYLLEWNFDAAAREYQRAIALDPDYADAHHQYAMYFMAVGHVDEMLAEIKQAEALDPLNLTIIADRGACFYLARRYDEALAQFGTWQNMAQNYGPDSNAAICYLQKGELAKAISELQRVNETDTAKGRLPADVCWLAVAYAMAGQRADAERQLSRAKEISKKQYVPKTFFAYVYAALGEKEQAFAMLDAALRGHDSTLLGLKTDPWFDPLRSDPRFVDLVSRVGR